MRDERFCSKKSFKNFVMNMWKSKYNLRLSCYCNNWISFCCILAFFSPLHLLIMSLMCLDESDMWWNFETPIPVINGYSKCFTGFDQNKWLNGAPNSPKLFETLLGDHSCVQYVNSSKQIVQEFFVLVLSNKEYFWKYGKKSYFWLGCFPLTRLGDLIPLPNPSPPPPTHPPKNKQTKPSFSSLPS